ncbi:MAG TPA: biopolymer transporter ExbD [Tepidisphaeraceae bacterium]|jgi:biopolymer transport protein ExbD
MKCHMPASHTSHPNVVPLIDIIMCLIIFFMLVAKIGVDTGEDEKIKIPLGLLGQEMKSFDNTLLVNVKESSGLAEVSALVEAGKGRERLVLEGGGTGRRLVDTLRLLRYGSDKKKGGGGSAADNDAMKLIIRGDADMTFGVLQKVLVAANEAGVTSVNFQTTTDKQGS